MMATNRCSTIRTKWAIGSLTTLVALIVGLVLVFQGNIAQAEFSPSADVTLSDYETGANADITSSFGVDAPDYNFAAVVSFTPPDWGVASDADVPDGAWVQHLHSVTYLGLFNNFCNIELDVNFDLLDATTDTTNSFTYDPVTEPVASEDWPGYEIMPSGLMRAVEEYPDFLNDLFDGDQPLARYFGYNNTAVSGTWIPLQFVLFEPGWGGYAAERGYPSVTVLQDPSAPPGVSAITDFCTPLTTDTTTFGISQTDAAVTPVEGGDVVRTNPCAPGDYSFSTYAESLRDADGDGIENDLDTCPYDENLGDPRSGGDDNDADHIDGACDVDITEDPNDDVNDNHDDDIDADGDGYWNRGDNCPQVANGPGEDNQADEDSDNIGDACDDNPTTPDGDAIEVDLYTDITITGEDICPAPAGVDSDGDGFDDATEEALGSCAEDPCPDEEFCSDIAAADSTPEDTDVTGTCTDEEDNDLDGYIDDFDGGCAEDTDEDGVSDEGEDELGSDPDDADSTPEHASVCDTCTDGTDNDLDGAIDAADEGCAVEVTPTPELTPTPEVEEVTPEVGVTPTPEVEVEICAPVFPGTYNGRVLIDGQPAASGYRVTASIDDIEWGSAIVSGGRYAMDIPDHLPTQAPCFQGGTIVFELDGMTCTPVEEGADVWASGLHDVDLTCAPVAPAVTPTPTPEITPTPEVTPTPTPVKPPPTGAGGLSGSSSALPLWAMALAGWVGLMTVAGLGTLVAAKRR